MHNLFRLPMFGITIAAGALALASPSLAGNDLPRAIPLGGTAQVERLAYSRQVIALRREGGVATIWHGGDQGPYTVHVQMIGADGRPLFAPQGGLVIATHGSNFPAQAIAAHPVEGAIAVYRRDGEEFFSIALFAQWFDANGERRWGPVERDGAAGVPVFEPGFAQSYRDPRMVTHADGSSTICAVIDVMPWASAVHCQRLSPSGERLWGPAGIDVGGATGAHLLPQVVEAADGGVIVTWHNMGLVTAPPVPQRIEGQRFAPSGQRLWGDDAKLIATTVRQTDYPFVEAESFQAVTDGDGGAIIVFADTLAGVGTPRDVVALRVGPSGQPVWSAPVIVASGTMDEHVDGVTPVRGGGAIVTTERSEGPATTSTRVHRIAANGALAWGLEGIALDTTIGVLRTAYTHPLVVDDLVHVPYTRHAAEGSEARLAVFDLDGAMRTPPGGVTRLATGGLPEVGGYVYDAGRDTAWLAATSWTSSDAEPWLVFDRDRDDRSAARAR